MSGYKLKSPGKIEEKVVGAYKKVEDKFVDTFLDKEDGSLKAGKVEEKILGGYKKIEDGVLEAYKKIENKFVDTFLEKVEDSED